MCVIMYEGQYVTPHILMPVCVRTPLMGNHDITDYKLIAKKSVDIKYLTKSVFLDMELDTLVSWTYPVLQIGEKTRSK